jgi:hypothetical protein
LCLFLSHFIYFIIFVFRNLYEDDDGVIYFTKTIEVVKPEVAFLLPKKIKNKKLYKSSELKAQLEKDFWKEKCGKAMVYNHFAIW